MDVTKLLEADHRHVEDLFQRIEKAYGDARSPMIDDLARSLRAHMELEEAVVYPSLMPITGDESVEEARTEHELARQALEEVLHLAPDEPGFGAALDAAKAGVDHHVHEEEQEVFPALRKDGADALAAMATPFMEQRMALGLPMEADALAASASKDELAEEARSAGVEGAASMSKAELAGALADRMSPS